MRLVFLDSGPLGLVCSPHGRPTGLRCQQWARDLIAAGVRVYVPEIADYEVRRKLLHAGATSLAAAPGDAVTVATDNVGHLARFVDAQP